MSHRDDSDTYVPVISKCLNGGGMKRIDGESETFVIETFQNTGQGWWNDDPVAQSLCAASLGGASHANLVCGQLQSGHTPHGHGAAGVNNQAAASGHLVPVLSPPLRSASDSPDAHNKQNGTDRGAPEEITPALKAQSGMSGKGDSAPCVAASGMAVRRLTPVECEKLQGFDPGYTQIPYRGKSAADGPRYAALGNSMAVPVMRWIAERILEADAQ